MSEPAGDADSIVSAIAWAYTEYLASQLEEERGRHCSSTMTPIVSIPAHDLTTQRPETTLLLEWAGIPADVLHFVDTLDEPSIVEKYNDDPVASTTKTIPDESKEEPVWNVTLVDHNRLSSSSLPLLTNNAAHHHKLCVVEIVDHHLDEGYHHDTCRHRNIAFAHGAATVASTCTLVVERLQEQDGSSFPAPLSLLLLGVILLDSVNLQPSAGKDTPRDVTAVQL